MRTNKLSHYLYLAGRRLLPTNFRESFYEFLRKAPSVGQVNFGDLRTLVPVSRYFGFDRGEPIDRHYIKTFLQQHEGDIRGRVLEIGDREYTRMFGGARVTTSDVFHVSADNPEATIVGDITNAPHVESDLFDCIVFTQTLQMIYDPSAAIRTLSRILKPGGVLLLTVPGVSMYDPGPWRHTWFYSFSSSFIKRLLEEYFPASGVAVPTYGNVLTATAFLQGLASSELRSEEFEFHDPNYELIVAARAVKAVASQS